MFNSDVESFSNDSVSDLFINDNTNGSWVDIEDCSGSSVVIFVWHTFMDGTVANNINNISDFVCSEILCNMNSTVLSETFSEFMSGSSFISVAVSHGLKSK